MSESSLGCYSVIRYRDALSDQQINLGVVLWHPDQGYKVFFLKDLEAAHAIAPNVPIQDLRLRLHVIREQVESDGTNGLEKFEALSNWFREGIEVTTPYPARFADLHSALEELRPTLFPHIAPELKALALLPSHGLSVQQPHRLTGSQFEHRVFRVIERAAKERNIEAHPIPPRKIGKVIVNPGFQTVAGRHKSLWRALAFRGNERRERQLSAAKAVAMEMYVLLNAPQFKDHERLVVVAAKKPSAEVDEQIAWLGKTANHVWSVESPEEAEKLLERSLRSAS